jgi:hypothetical protein
MGIAFQFVANFLTFQMEHGAKAHLKHLTEYFAFLNEFSKMGEEESQFLISVHAISSMVNFYLGQKAQDYVSNLVIYIGFCYRQLPCVKQSVGNHCYIVCSFACRF